MNNNKRCTRCGEGTMKSWVELDEEEREVVKRLSGTADYKAAERESRHRWCTLCWYEEVSDSEAFA